MTSPTSTADKPPKVTSLRSWWNRTFALLAITLVIGGLTTVIATHLMLATLQKSAVKDERDAAALVKLRESVVSYTVIVAKAFTGSSLNQVNATQSATRAAFTDTIVNARNAQTKGLFEEARAQWQAIVDAVGPLDHPVDQATRIALISTKIPKVLDLLDQAVVADRADVRIGLKHAALLNRESTAVLVLVLSSILVLCVRLAKRFSAEVLRPVAKLRDSADRLAYGELDHRVVVDRPDELGALAASFNAMADAIAASQHSLTLEASTDALSGLANRAAFSASLDATLARPERRRGGTHAVLFVDIDDFKEVNDTLGHAAGDELLRVVAGRLIDALRPGDVVARIGGDEFAVLLAGLSDPDLAIAMAERVLAALDEPINVGESRVRVGASIGSAIRRDDSTRVELMRQADVAMYAAKAAGKRCVAQYHTGLDDHALARRLLNADVGDAADRGELVLDYQPVVDLDTGTLVGLEALLRWQHPTRGLLFPSAFIDLAEETGAIVGIGAWVLETAARQLHSWQHRYGLSQLWMSVNVSVRQLDLPGFADNAENIIRAAKVAPASLVLEVTESVLADPEGGVAATLATLRRFGVRVALDDFGAGYSSIRYLCQLPVDVIKIDHAFVSGVYAGERAQALLEAIVSMAQRLGLEVIPEGIEEPDQLFRLRAMGCHMGQGFLLARPASAAAIEALLAAPTSLLPDIGMYEAVSRA